MRIWHQNCGLALTAIVLLSACDKKNEASADETAAQKSPSAEAAIVEHVENAAEKAGAGFLKESSKKACEVLTPQLVAATFDVPEAELKQTKVMGCIYNWKNKKSDPDEIVEVNLLMMMFHKDEERAKTWFANSTKNVTQAEAKAQMAEVTKRAQEHKSVDTELKKETTAQLGGIMGEAAGAEGFVYEPMAGIGDQAAMGMQDGSLKVRVENLTFSLTAYKGPPQPKLDLQMSDMKDLKKLTAKSMEAQRAWIKKTMPQRKQAVRKLAPLVVQALR